ncbi:cytochrome P450 [Aspergillus coremiiformis]|uniref:Cytochrome P450 n=1 Tax=Aspergillus coremiiformis TaxID=138285 RepID=A0A5N6Z1P2_9EURO|nr:cytochrome P450 [Aspergillus coremiiformis]
MATILTELLSPSPSQIVPAFLILGAAFHQCIRTTEIDNRVCSLVALYLGTYLFLCFGYIHFFSLSWLRAAVLVLLAAFCFNIGLTISVILYRAFFHRLRHFPGPWKARLSRLYTVQQGWQRTQYHLDLEALHRKHGDFVRMGPREISINRPSAVHTINGPQSSCTRSTWYSRLSDDITQVSLNSTRDPEVHRRRRRAWDRGFSMKALATYEPSVQHKVEVLVAQVRSRLDEPLNVSQWTMYFAFDVMGLVGFSKDFRQLEEDTEHAAIKELHNQMLVIGLLKPVPWALSILHIIRGAVGNYGQFMNYCAGQIAEKKYQWNVAKDKTPRDVISWLLKALEEQDPSAPPGNQALNEDGRLMIIAGSDTIGITLAHALYYLTKYPSTYRKLQLELDSAFAENAKPSEFNNEKLRNLPYLDAIINETLRLKPAVPSGQPRLTPPEGLQIDEVWIPGDTIVVVPQYVIQRDDRNFPSGAEFIPERWLEDKEKLILHEEAFFPFQIGRYACVGKQLALTQLRDVLSRIAFEFDLSFAPDEDGISFDEDSKDTFALTVGPLRLVFKERVRI